MKIFKRLFMLTLMATMLVTIPGNIKAEGEASVATTITVTGPEDIKGCQLDTDGKIIAYSECFKDETFRQIVYNTLFDANNDDAYYKEIPENETMLDLLSDFDGDINASANTIKKKNINEGKLITSVFGLQFLRHASEVNLEHNKIEDWTELSREGFSNDYYGGIGTNVFWKIGGNPFKKLPESFGGFLVIAQAATTHSEYNEVKTEFRYLRRTNISGLTGKIKLEEIAVVDSSNNETKISPISITNTNHKEPFRQFVKINSVDTAANTVSFNLTNLDTSGQEMIAVGLDQEIHYETTDDNSTITPGSQSFKYYLHPYFYVYDKLTVETKDTASIVFTKKDSADETIVLPGAVYKLIKPDGSDESFITNAKGQFILDVSVLGKYTLEETTPPAGYEKSNDIIEFKVVAPTNVGTSATITINGGTDSFTDSNQPAVQHTANSNPNVLDAVYLGGKFDKDLQTNKEMSFETTNANDVKKVIVTYASLFDGKIAHETVKTFSNTNGTALTDAATDINTQNTTGMLRGDVKVEVVLEDHIQDANGVAIHELSQTNTKTPPVEPEEPDTPGRPHKPSDPKDPEEPEIPLIPLEPSTPVEPIEPGPNTPEPPTPGVNTSDSSNPSLWISLMLVASGIMVVVYRKKKQYN